MCINIYMYILFIHVHIYIFTQKIEYNGATILYKYSANSIIFLYLKNDSLSFSLMVFNSL